MAADFEKLFDKIDARLLSNQSITPKKLAKELNITVQDIEKAVREVENVAFSEYRRYRRLTSALKTINVEKASNVHGGYAERRTLQRLTIPHATVRYHLYGRGITRSRFSRRCPLKDLSQEGIAFFSDRFLQPDRMVSVLISSADRKDAVQLEGRIVYAAPVSVANYRYCMGIQFAPFDAQTGNNSQERLKDLIRFAQACCIDESEEACPSSTAQIHYS
jgi:hypothetical protein